jgi:hypothetical protein
MNEFTQAQFSGMPQQEFVQHKVMSKMASDMNFMAIYSIVMGALTCLSIIGAAIGIPQIFAGLRLRESSEAFKSYLTTNNPAALQFAFERQQRYFFITKVLAIVGIILAVLGIIFYFVMISLFLTHGSHYINKSI